MKKITSSIITLSLLATLAWGQPAAIKLSLKEALELAQKQSLQSFLNKHNYMAQYWSFKSFRADYLPSVSLTTTPISYANSANLRYNSATRQDEYIRTENLSSYLSMNVSQKVALTGGTVYVESALNRIENFGSPNYIQFASNPYLIGYRQELFGYNAMKWERLIAPMQFEKSKKEFVEATETVNIQATQLFFQLVRAEAAVDIAQTNRTNTTRLLDVANKRFELGTVSREELLDLRLTNNNAEISLREALMNLRSAREDLLNYLMLPVEALLTTDIPNVLGSDSINTALALNKALANNPLPVGLEQNLLESRRDVAQTRSAQRFQANMNLSYGINKTNGNVSFDPQQGTYVPTNGQLNKVYQPDFDSYQQVAVTISIPILDWGKGKGKIEMARSRQQVAEISAHKTRQQFEQNVITRSVIFNLQKDKVAFAAVSDTLAQSSYELTMTRFNNGKTDVLKLNAAQQAKDNARLQYLNTLAEYWNQYYMIRKLTLYDFENNKDIELNDYLNQ